MNLIKRATAVCLLAPVIAASLFTASSLGADTQPGGSADPLVTKSYVDDKINQALSGSLSGQTYMSNQEVVNDVMAQIEFLYGSEAPSGSGGGNTTFIPVFVAAGQIITGHEGTEIILRSGSANAYCPGENGLVNITTGGDMNAGASVPSNNLLIVPRGDGRGVQSVTDSWFIVKGGYDLN